MSQFVLTRLKSDDDSGKDDDCGKTDDCGKHNGGTRGQPGTKTIAEGAAAGFALVSESSNAAIEFWREFSLTAKQVLLLCMSRHHSCP